MIELYFKQEGKLYLKKSTINAIQRINKYEFKVWISFFKHNPCIVYGDSDNLFKEIKNSNQ